MMGERQNFAAPRSFELTRDHGAVSEGLELTLPELPFRRRLRSSFLLDVVAAVPGERPGVHAPHHDRAEILAPCPARGDRPAVAIGVAALADHVRSAGLAN